MSDLSELSEVEEEREEREEESTIKATHRKGNRNTQKLKGKTGSFRKKEEDD